MAYELLTLERHDNGVAVLTLANGKVNALSGALVAEIDAAAQELTASPPPALIISGGDRIFAAGAEISEFGGPVEAKVIGPEIHAAFDRLAALPCLVIAAVSGYALGGGCELSLACDYRIASERAVFGQPEILLGIIPGGGGTQRLARVVGPSKAKEMCLTGRQVKADEALRIGLADEVVSPEELMDRALDLGATLANGATVGQGICKRAIDEGLSTSLAAGLRIELDAFVEVFGTEDSQIGVKSFLENGPGKAEFVGR
ncbi:MAG: enoyl-CoA hydratase-related protein [Ilumatobacter sp.]|jgi:enoyl-CoA hydratase|nr:enoyl-CoA hydratase-related protein [Ilumatobacter sp.]MDG1695769.1 enoyl-CoA hydratase-related protein [Ilumatobacter sp.]MDG2439640.1 enoyl-CoA hydratase-related protein [Ilumatobacter sp.]